MSEEGDGSSVAATRQKAGSVLYGGIPRPPLYPRPRPAVFAVTLPGTSGTGPSVPASAEEPPPPSVAGFAGTTKAPALTTWASVTVVFAKESEASRSQAAGVFGVLCALATTGTSPAINTNTPRMGTPFAPDLCLDHREPDLGKRLAAACPTGVDVYFENVGGAVFDAVLPRLNVGARIPLCGFVASYNDENLPPGPNRVPLLQRTLLEKRVRLQGFIILDHYATRFESFRRDMTEWTTKGQVKLREDVVDGLENAPGAFIGMLAGRNFGKLVVRLAEGAPHLSKA